MPKKKGHNRNKKGRWSTKIPDKYLDSELEKAFYLAWKAQYPKHMPAREYRFHTSRMFRFDFAWPTKKIAVETQGMGPGHFSLPGMTADCEKGLEALLLNWRVVYLTSTFLQDKNMPTTLRKIARLLDLKVIAEVPRKGYVPMKKR